MCKECRVHVEYARAECGHVEFRRQRHVEREDRACERVPHLTVGEWLADAGVGTYRLKRCSEQDRHNVQGTERTEREGGQDGLVGLRVRPEAVWQPSGGMELLQ